MWGSLPEWMSRCQRRQPSVLLASPLALRLPVPQLDLLSPVPVREELAVCAHCGRVLGRGILGVRSLFG